MDLCLNLGQPLENSGAVILDIMMEITIFNNCFLYQKDLNVNCGDGELRVNVRPYRNYYMHLCTA